MGRVITPNEWRRQVWKNGRGVTYEVLREPASAPTASTAASAPAGDDYELRISVAEVSAAGPFSTFPGYRRWTTKIDGGAVALEMVREAPERGFVLGWNGVMVIERGEVVELCGEDELAASVSAPARLLNVLARGPMTEVGYGTSRGPVDIAIALGDLTATVYDVPERVFGDVVWITR